MSTGQRWGWAAWAVVGALGAPADAVAAEVILTLDGEVPDDGLDHFFVPFDVPEGTIEIEIRHAATTTGVVLDWGLDDPDGFRGWGGGNGEPAVVGETAASRSYRPGAIAPGPWAVVVGKALVQRYPATYQLEIVLRDSDATLAPQPERAPYEPSPPLTRGPGWYAGDFHVHSDQSGDASATLAAITTLAAERGLDFVEITDHNVHTNLDFFNAAQTASPDVLLVPGVEFTTYQGHANGIGATQWVDHKLGQRGVSITGAAEAFAEQGAVFSINHPALDIGNLCLGCAWDHRLDGAQIGAVEIATGGLEPFGMTFSQAAIDFWDALCDQGHHVAAVGGSDDHKAGVDLSPFQSPIGDATTLVYASELSAAAIVTGVANARTVVKLQGPGDPTVHWDAVEPLDADTIAAASATLVATITGATGDSVELWKNGSRVEQATIDADPMQLQWTVDAPDTGQDRYRVEVRVDGRRRVITSHLWVVDGPPGATDGGIDSTGGASTSAGTQADTQADTMDWTSTGDAGSTETGAAGASDNSAGCGCTTGPGQPTPTAWLLGGLALLGLRRRPWTRASVVVALALGVAGCTGGDDDTPDATGAAAPTTGGPGGSSGADAAEDDWTQDVTTTRGGDADDTDAGGETTADTTAGDSDDGGTATGDDGDSSSGGQVRLPPFPDLALGPYPSLLTMVLDSIASNADGLDTSDTYTHSAGQGYLLQAIGELLWAARDYDLPERDALLELALAEIAELQAADDQIVGGGPGFGLPDAWDAFGDGSENPAFTAYTWQSGMVVLGVAKVARALQVAEHDQTQTTVDYATALVQRWDTNYTSVADGGYWWYSTQPSDAIAVHNTSALVAMAAQIASEVGGDASLAERPPLCADLLWARTSGNPTVGYTWNYADDGLAPAQRRAEDVSHALVTLQLMRHARDRDWWTDSQMQGVAQTLLSTMWSGNPARLHGFVDGTDGGDSEWSWTRAAAIGYAAHGDAPGGDPEVFEAARSILFSSYLSRFERPLQGGTLDSARTLAAALVLARRPDALADGSEWEQVAGDGDDAIPAMPGGVRFYTVDWAAPADTAAGLTLPARTSTAANANLLVDLEDDDTGRVLVSIIYSSPTAGQIRRWDGAAYQSLGTLPATIHDDGTNRWLRTTVEFDAGSAFDYQAGVPGKNVLLEVGLASATVHRIEATRL